MDNTVMWIVIVIISVYVILTVFLLLVIFLPYKFPKALTKIIDRAASTLALKGLTHDEAYTQKGDIRSNVQKKITNQKKNISLFLKNNGDLYTKELLNAGLLKDNKMKKWHIKKAAAILIYLYSGRKDFQQVDGITVDEFFSEYKVKDGDVVGVYILYNEDKNMYYVGQAKRIYYRVNQHFTAHGNGDVYADYKHGDSFLIRLLPLMDSGYSDLDLFEKEMIMKYDALGSGYNKTKGNG